jgi:hypothetical protein
VYINGPQRRLGSKKFIRMYKRSFHNEDEAFSDENEIDPFRSPQRQKRPSYGAATDEEEDEAPFFVEERGYGASSSSLRSIQSQGYNGGSSSSGGGSSEEDMRAESVGHRLQGSPSRHNNGASPERSATLSYGNSPPHSVYHPSPNNSATSSLRSGTMSYTGNYMGASPSHPWTPPSPGSYQHHGILTPNNNNGYGSAASPMPQGNPFSPLHPGTPHSYGYNNHGLTPTPNNNNGYGSAASPILQVNPFSPSQPWTPPRPERNWPHAMLGSNSPKTESISDNYGPLATPPTPHGRWSPITHNAFEQSPNAPFPRYESSMSPHTPSTPAGGRWSHPPDFSPRDLPQSLRSPTHDPNWSGWHHD